jgi:flagellar hook-associated protein 2
VFVETVSAQNAQVQVDGYPAGPPWIERSSNRISDVLQGVTLDLLDTGASTTVTVSTDKNAITEKIQMFLEDFNAIRSAIRDATSYDADTGASGTLLGNYAVQIIKMRLDTLVTGGVAGFQDPGDAYSSLQQIGFSTDALQGSSTEGELILDTATLSQALDTDPEAVARLFSTYLDGVTDSSQIRFSSSLSTATPGIYSVEVDTDTGKGRFRIEGGDWGEWLDLDGVSGSYTLTGMTGPERGVALDVAFSAGSGTQSATFRLRNGVAPQLSNELTALLSTSGPLNTLEDNYYKIIDNMTERIDDEEQRISGYEETLRKRFSRLDVYISQMNGLSESIASFASSFISSSK